MQRALVAHTLLIGALVDNASESEHKEVCFVRRMAERLGG